jgi:hypothetical protein
MFDPMISCLIDKGELPVEKVDTRITLHDPCHSTRLAGMGDAMRNLLNNVTTNFIEMTPNREYNYCCNGGAGGLRLPENTGTRRQISILKANQIRNTGAENVTTPCVVCMLSLEDTCQTYNLGQTGQRMASMTFEIVYEAMEKALAKRGELERLRIPAELKDCDETFFMQHSSSGVMMALMQSPDAIDILEWLEQDDVVKRHASTHPEVWDQLAEFKRIANETRILELPVKQRVIGGRERLTFD